MATAILGGVFDPIHNEHLHIAQQALTDYSLDEVIFVPAHSPPHKPQPRASAPHRLRMLTCALEGWPGFSISTCELERKGTSYTIDTLHTLNPDFLICGEDAYQELNSWKSAALVKKRVRFIVIPRSNPLSSSLIRDKIKQGESLSGLVPESVEAYIEENGLYR